MIPSRTIGQYGVRALCGVVLLILPLIGAPALVIIAVIAAWTAYDGVIGRQGSLAPVMVWMALVMELVYGMDLGVLSGAVLGASLLGILFGRFIALTPWAGQQGWRLSDAFRMLIISVGYIVVVTLLAWLLGQLMYGYGDAMARLRLSFSLESWFPALAGMISTLVMLRRIDEPFRRPLWPANEGRILR